MMNLPTLMQCILHSPGTAFYFKSYDHEWINYVIGVPHFGLSRFRPVDSLFLTLNITEENNSL